MFRIQKYEIFLDQECLWPTYGQVYDCFTLVSHGSSRKDLSYTLELKSLQISNLNQHSSITKHTYNHFHAINRSINSRIMKNEYYL